MKFTNFRFWPKADLPAISEKGMSCARAADRLVSHQMVGELTASCSLFGVSKLRVSMPGAHCALWPPVWPSLCRVVQFE